MIPIHKITLQEYKETTWTKVRDWFHKTWRWSPLRNLYYNILNRFVKKHYLIDIRLPKTGYYDVNTKMLHGMMSLLLDYIEKEDPFNFIDWDWDEEYRDAKKEIIAIKEWWENYGNRQKEYEDILDEWSRERLGEEGDDIFERLSTLPNEKAKKLSCRMHKMEEELLKEEEEMLIRLVKVRNFLWT